MHAGSRRFTLLMFLIALLIPVGATSAAPGSVPSAALSCVPAVAASPLPAASPAAPVPASSVAPSAPPADPIKLSVGYVAVSIYAPVFLAKAKGYYDAHGVDVTLEPFDGGSEPVALTASGQVDLAATGAGPGFWNAAAQGLPVQVVAPGHREGNPVATPLMISRKACESGAITRIADLKGKKVSVNARGATEYWLSQALATDGLTLDDIDLQTLAFPTAVTALESGALDAAMVGEPLATQAERSGVAVRLATDFPVQNVQPTVILANSDFARAHPAAVEGFVAAYLQACRDLSGSGFNDPANLAIISTYTGVPADLIGSAVKPVYAANGEIDLAALNALQLFFRSRGQLEYDDNLDPAAVVDTTYVEAALVELGRVAES